MKKLAEALLRRFPNSPLANYFYEFAQDPRRNLSLRKRRYAGRHRSDPQHETQYSNDPVTGGILVAVPRERRTPVTILRSIRHPKPSVKEPAKRILAVGRVSRQQVELIATLTVAMAMVKLERLALTTGPSYNFTQT